MTKKTIDFQNIDPKFLGDYGLQEQVQRLHMANLSPETINKYKDAIDPNLSFRTRLRRFFTATSEAGRWAKVIKDFALIFVPFGNRIKDITELISYLIRTANRTKRRDPVMEWILNRLSEKTTWRGMVTVATALGVSLSPDQSAAIVSAGVALVGLIEVFFKEPQSKDSKNGK